MYFTESFENIKGTTALFFFKFFEMFLSNFVEKFGLAASCIKTLRGLYFLIYLRAFKEESDLSLPPLMTIICFEYFFFF